MHNAYVDWDKCPSTLGPVVNKNLEFLMSILPTRYGTNAEMPYYSGSCNKQES